MSGRIAEYEIAEEIGRGGFGRVYKAYDPKVGREVAIKTLNDTNDAELISRFRVEAAAAGNLRHANIVTIYEFGESQGTHFLAMEYLPGSDLNRLIKDRHGISVLESMTIMNQVAQGLSFAHNHGVVHRDVKPANIMVLPDGMVKIMDFGIARLTSSAQHNLTKSGFIIGTLLYLAPEQFAGRPFDSLCDLWAFGVVYYELLTGENPFKAGDDASIMYRITASDPPPIRSVRPDCPVELEQIVTRLLKRNRDDRYQSLEDVIFDSEPILQRLRKDRASGLREVVESLIREEKLEQAQLAVRQMLELDPSNDQARRWRDQLRKQVREKEIKPRLQGLMASADAEVEKKRFDEASQLLQSALSLDPGNMSVQNRLEGIRRAQEHYQRVQSLLQQAMADLKAQNVSNALFRASEAAAADPQSEAAKQLVQQIKEYADQRDKLRKIDSALAMARDLMQSRSYDQALGLLQELRSAYPNEFQIQELIGEVATHQAKDRFNARLAEGISRARELLQTEKFSEADALLKELCREFPDDQTVRELHSFATKQNEGRQNKTQAEAIGRQAWDLAKAANFEGALKIADEGLRRLPAEAILVRVRVAIRSAQARHEEETDVKTILEISRGLREQKQLDEAITALQGGLRRFPTRAELLELLGKIQAEQQQQKREMAEQARAELERAFAPEPPLPWDAAVKPVEEVAKPAAPAEVAPAVDSRRHPAFDPGSSQGRFPVLAPSESPRKSKTWLWGAVAGGGVVILFAGLTIFSRPAEHKEPAQSKTESARVEPTPTPIEVSKPALPEPPKEKDKKTSPPVEVIKTETPKPVAPDRSGNSKPTERVSAPQDPPPVIKAPEVAKIPVHEEAPKVAVSTPPPNPPAPAAEQVSKTPWHGDDSGQLRWHGNSLAPGATMDITRGPTLDGSGKFPWLRETKVQVRVVSPPNVAVEVQPSRGNNWSLIRLRNNGTEPVLVVALAWQIVE